MDFNDIIFALHALVLCVIILSQYLFTDLWGFTPAAGNRPSKVITGIATGCVLGVLLTYLIAAGASGSASGASSASSGVVDPAEDWCALDVVYAVGYVKLLVTLVKYTPQVIANWRNKSTTGWSIWQVLLDLIGGVLSVGQLGIDSYLQRDWSGVTGNPIKFALGNVSIVYDTIFIVQHYGLYRKKQGSAAAEEDEERQRLLDAERR